MISTMAQITNAMLVSEYQVELINEFSAKDKKGFVYFLSDLRAKYFKDAKKIEKRKARENKIERKVQVAENIEELFSELKNAFPSENVLIRKTQPGIKADEYNVYCIASHTGRSVVNMDSKIFNQKDLQDLFGDYKLYDNTDRGVTIGGLEANEIVSVVERLIKVHKELS